MANGKTLGTKETNGRALRTLANLLGNLRTRNRTMTETFRNTWLSNRLRHKEKDKGKTFLLRLFPLPVDLHQWSRPMDLFPCHKDLLHQDHRSNKVHHQVSKRPLREVQPRLG